MLNISHPTVENLLKWHDGDRSAARDHLQADVMEQAKRLANYLGLSANCEADLCYGAKHHRCRNDGSTCLCVCHDPNPAMKEKAS